MEFKLVNLSDVLKTDDLKNLSAADRKAYDVAFKAFKADFNEKNPEGKVVTLQIVSNRAIPVKGEYRFEFKPGADVFTPVFQKGMKSATVDIIATNSLNVSGEVFAVTLASAQNKGAFKVTVKVVDESDSYLDKDGNVAGNYTMPGVARIGNIEYVPSTEVRALVQKVYTKMQDRAIERMFATPETALVLTNAPESDEPEI